MYDELQRRILSTRSRLLVGALIASIAIMIAATSAMACACCTDTAWRRVEVEKLDSARLAEIANLRFAKAAFLKQGESDGGIKGLPDARQAYDLTMTHEKDRMVFALRDDKGRTGGLTLAMPKTISIFEVDPRGDEKDKGLGPTLYKEWKLTAKAVGSGIFQTATAGQSLTLVLHGRGLACTSYEQFTDWTLLVHGKGGAFTMYGALDSAGK